MAIQILYSLWHAPVDGMEGQHDQTKSTILLHEFDRISEAYWLVPATCPDDPDYERSYAMSAYARSHRSHYWLAQYPTL